MEVIKHSWGSSPEQKRKERDYNHEYYETHQEKWAQYRNKHKDLAKEQRAYTSTNANAMNEAAKQAVLHDIQAKKYDDRFTQDAVVQITMEMGSTLVDLILQDITRR